MQIIGATSDGRAEKPNRAERQPKVNNSKKSLFLPQGPKGQRTKVVVPEFRGEARQPDPGTREVLTQQGLEPWGSCSPYSRCQEAEKVRETPLGLPSIGLPLFQQRLLVAALSRSRLTGRLGDFLQEARLWALV